MHNIEAVLSFFLIEYLTGTVFYMYKNGALRVLSNGV